MKVRFAPSPTGYLHIGGARTCLFNWLTARGKGGAFILRIEDTDVERSKPEYLEEILDSLKWLGLNWDELHHQSGRFEIYRKVAQDLLAKGLAYAAEDGSGAVILKMPLKVVKMDDMIHGSIEFDTALIKDQVLMKSDGSPTYNFACVVDDNAMGITHIIRGDDHISNSPKQIVIYEALGYPLPKFAHIPMILGEGGGRMSKRHGATAITEYRRMGFLPEALVNYLLLLGWAPGPSQVICSLKEATERFDIMKANKTAATFDMNKLLWLNSQYIMAQSLERLADLVRPFLNERYPEAHDFDGKRLEPILKLYRERATTLIELADNLRREIIWEDADRVKYFGTDLSREFAVLKERFSKMPDFSALKIEEVFRATVAELGTTVKTIIHPLRMAMSGKSGGPGMFEMIEALGKERTLERMERVIGVFQKKI
jgi:glutamyl-tRNA synthetase